MGTNGEEPTKLSVSHTRSIISIKSIYEPSAERRRQNHKSTNLGPNGNTTDDNHHSDEALLR
eukprot:scaffold175753_cov63-Attheya_sp.AAC.1